MVKEINVDRPRMVLSKKEFYERMDRERYEGDNHWYAKEFYGREPTREECYKWYKDHGGEDDFNSRYCIGDTSFVSYIYRIAGRA